MSTTSALLVMDFQTAILPRLGDQAGPLVERTAQVVAAARAAGVPVMYVVVGFRAGYPEVDPDHKTFGPLTKMGGALVIKGNPADEVLPGVAPREDEPVIVKRRVSAFYGTDLDVILRARKIDHLYLAGVATSGVVLSTTRHAADADYRLSIIRDCCADPDPDVHAVLLDKVLARQADILTAAEVRAALGTKLA